MAKSATQTIQKHYLRILRSWPTDHLRGLTMAYTIPRRLALRALPASDASATLPSSSSAPASSPSTPTSSADVPAPARPPIASDEMTQVNALYSLLDDRYSTKYPTSERMLRPGFKEDYYAELARELEEAPKRGWWARTMIKWGKIVRFS